MIEEVSSDAFINIRYKINNLVRITDKYLFTDLVKAIFCINICINNRSMIETGIALNACLVEHKGIGKKEIKNYDDFSKFFSEIRSFCQPTLMDDYTTEDFGEVRINYNDVFYKVILGTGHNNVFACINLLPSLANEINKETELTLIFEYVSSLIDFFADVNINDGVEKVRFVIPSLKLFERTNQYFEKVILNNNVKNVSNIFEPTRIIEKMHFINKENVVFPLFNTSILVDLYDQWERKLSIEKKINFINNGIIDKIFKLFSFDRSDVCGIFAPASIFSDGKPSDKKTIYTFMAKATKGVIIAINTDEYTENSLNKEIKMIQDLHKSNNLQIGEVYDRFNSKKLRALAIKREEPLVFLLYNSYSNINSIDIIVDKKSSKKTYTALDVIYFLDFMDNIDELYDYLTYRSNPNEESDQFLGYGGEAALFLLWKSENHHINKGAKRYHLIDVGYQTENEFVVDYFKNCLKVYPFISGDGLFSEPLSWKIGQLSSDVYSFCSKFGAGIGGSFIPLNNNNFIFQLNNTEYYKDFNTYIKYKTINTLLEELITEGIRSLKNIFLDYKIQLMFMPIEYAKSVKPTDFLNEDRDYCYSDTIYYKGKWLIKYVVKDIDKIFNDIQSSSDRRIEFDILEEILLPLLMRDIKLNHKFKSSREKFANKPKMVGVSPIKINYHWNDTFEPVLPNENHYNKVRKTIANLCSFNDISPGVYKGKEANRVIRKMQKNLIEDFEKEVLKFSGIALNVLLIDHYSLLLHDIYINKKRYGSYQNLDDRKNIEVKSKIINQREESRYDARKTLYLLETNIYLNKESNVVPKQDDFLYLLAYANWLTVLNDVADICYFTEDDAYITINDDFTVDTLTTEDDEKNIQIISRVYDNTMGLDRDKYVDEKYIKKFKNSFEKETSLNFEIFIALLTYLSANFDYTKSEKLGRNVYCVTRDIVLNDFIKEYNLSIDLQKACMYLDFITINERKLKTVKDKSDYYLPIGNRKDRQDRFEIKPIQSYGDKIIFSPITINKIKSDWIYGVFDFILPFTIGLKDTVETLNAWKSEYERKIVYDLERIFLNEKFDVVRKNFELKKLSKSHPLELGDYDVFAIDKLNKRVWIIECKVLMKTLTTFDTFTQQKRFFIEEKEDEKFQRRIDYLNNNIETVLEQLGLSDTKEYKVLPYMCVNKVFMSRYKKISFPIVSFSEMVDLIQNHSEHS